MRRTAAIKPLVWLVTIALLAQSWLVPLAMASVSAKVDGIVICTASGFKVISPPDGLGPPRDDGTTGDDQRQALDCAACLVQAAVQANATPSADTVLWRWPDRVESPAQDLHFTSSGFDHAHPSRAPPVAA